MPADSSHDGPGAAGAGPGDVREPVDLLIVGGTVLTMDADSRVISGGGVAVRGERIVAVGEGDALRARFRASRTIDATHKAIMPGLVDTYGHAGHGLIRGFFHPDHGWPSGPLYWHATTEEWWKAEARLAAVERLGFGVTTGASIIGSTPARTDSPSYALRNAEAYAEVGIRAVLGVGPPDPFISHIPAPWTGTHFVDGRPVERRFTYDEALDNAVEVIRRWHGGAGGRIRVALAPAYLFGRHEFHGRFAYDYQPADVPVMIEKAEEMRALADRHRVQMHTHMFRGSVAFALRRFGRDRVERLLGPDVVVAHGNGLDEEEVATLGAAHCNVAASPSTAENVWYGYAPVVALLDAGANVAIATDGAAPRFSFDLWKDVPRAMWHQWIAHRSMNVLPPGKALRMVTIDAARALGIDDRVGSLEPGKDADVITVDLNQPHLTPETFVPNLLAYYASGRDVDNVVVAGRLLMEDRRLVGIDVGEVLGAAREEAARAFDRVDLTAYREMPAAYWNGSRF